MKTREKVEARAAGNCEWCGLPIHSPNIHHRWYPNIDSPENLMLVHRDCHKSIHFGGQINATRSSLAANRDKGKGMTQQWREYLTKRASKTT